ncbi:MAG: competence/damage-inducible protein A, partial [Clostridiales Family XIII bacterium]|nr:competence/damage-inducible protein A [Clostridiales Family XIII bacterium]
RGIDVLYHYTVGDNPERLRDTLTRALAETDLVITSGGLGPTQDDLTKEIIAETAGRPLVQDAKALDMLTKAFERFRREITENNYKQTYLPEGAEIFYNEVGTAPGFALEWDGRIVIALPGPPRELIHLFETWVAPYLERRADSVIYYRVLRCYGIGESALETELRDLIDGQTDPTIATYAKEGECTVRIASKRRTRAEAEEAVAAMEARIGERVGAFVYSDADEDLADVVARKLVERGLTVACAESCTGGLFASSLIGYPGISAVFDRGWVTYSNASKEEELGVGTVAEYGAVSEETAIAMAQGVRERTGAAVCVSVTGIAGPDGAVADKPAGMAWICVIFEGNVSTKRVQTLNRGRNLNRQAFVLAMMDLINKTIG